MESDCGLNVASSAWFLSKGLFAQQVEVLFNGFTALMVQRLV